MDALVKQLDTKLRQWEPAISEQVRQCIVEIIQLADQGISIDVMHFPALNPVVIKPADVGPVDIEPADVEPLNTSVAKRPRAKTALELSPEEWKQYSLPKRVITPDIQVRWQQAWELIPKLTQLLREEFGATKIKIFGSAINVNFFSMTSDIDLAAWGIPIDKYFIAALAVHEFSPDFKVDLVDPIQCNPKLLERIETEGIDV